MFRDARSKVKLVNWELDDATMLTEFLIGNSVVASM